MQAISSASVGLTYWGSRTHFSDVELQCSSSSKSSLTKTRYKNVDKTPPCLTPWWTSNHLDCFWFTITALTVLQWQSSIICHNLPLIPRLWSLYISPCLQTVSKALLVSKKLIYMLLPCSRLWFSVSWRLNEAVIHPSCFWKPCCCILGKVLVISKVDILLEFSQTVCKYKAEEQQVCSYCKNFWVYHHLCIWGQSILVST